MVGPTRWVVALVQALREPCGGRTLPRCWFGPHKASNRLNSGLVYRELPLTTALATSFCTSSPPLCAFLNVNLALRWARC